MKKFLLGLLLIVAGIGQVSAQCTPDPQYTSPGIYPDSATGLPAAYVNQMYDETVTAVVPEDTCVVIVFPPCQDVTIDSILVDQVNGLPPGFTYECVQPNCAFYGGTSGCMRIYSTTNPTIQDTGRYNLEIYLTTYSFVSQQDVVDYYYIDILDSTGSNVGEIQEERIELGQNIPNPSHGTTTINLTSGSNAKVTFEVVNLVGKVVHSEQVTLRRGQNRIELDTRDYSPGIYMYSVNNGNLRYSKKMMVR